MMETKVGYTRRTLSDPSDHRGAGQTAGQTREQSEERTAQITGTSKLGWDGRGGARLGSTCVAPCEYAGHVEL